MGPVEVGNPQPVEDGERVEERSPDRPRRDGGREALGYLDRVLDESPVAHPAGDDEQFQIEREALLNHLRENGRQRLAPDELDASLGVPCRQPEEQPCQLPVTERVQPSEWRIDDIRARMELAAKDHIRIARPDRRKEVVQLPSRNVAVAVDEAEVAASPLSQADAQRGSLALVFRQLDYPDLVDPGDRRWASVRRAVRYRDHLEGEPLGPQGSLRRLAHEKPGAVPGCRTE